MNPDWEVDYMNPDGTGITGVSLEFVYPTYTVEYDNNGGTGSISSYNVGYNQSFKISDGTGISKAGYELDNWCVLRKTHRNSYNDSNIMTEVFCTDGVIFAIVSIKIQKNSKKCLHLLEFHYILGK